MRASLLPLLLPRRLPVFPSLRRTFSAATRPVPDPQPQEQRQPAEEQSNQTSPDQNATSNPISDLIYPSFPSQHHTDLSSFLSYAARTNLDRTSTFYVGTHFEYTACAALARLGFSLRRVGGTADCGIDLLGTWDLPPRRAPPAPALPAPPPLRVLAQCKAVQRPGPHLVRELEGAFAGAPAGWRGRRGATSGVMGVLVTEKSATRGIREALGRSRWPMVFVACSRAGKVGQVLWNRGAEMEGLEGLGIGKRYTGEGSEVVLSWEGEYLPLASAKGGSTVIGREV
ncbi:hypothetical protein MFIFM68171_09036 [Madurella fahalii]|uniref:Required for respiratory growth protein 7, mitochondrial n=1 Tax=Madurella fahalii TaxID=1157608 RepID=A0ABQ0GM43_9PEZI